MKIGRINESPQTLFSHKKFLLKILYREGIMRKEWMKVAVLLVLVLLACSCATTKEEKKPEKESAEDYYHKGQKEFKEGDYLDAVTEFKKAVEMDGKYFKAYYALGRSYDKLNKTKEAEEAYEEALKINPKSLPAREALGINYFHQKKFDEAEKHLKEARTLGSKVAEVYYGLGEIEQREHACRTAIIAFNQALKLDPDYMPARNGLKAAEDDCRKKQLQQSGQQPKPVQQQPKTVQPR
jgi:Tfp pilus assembly protein PilF